MKIEIRPKSDINLKHLKYFRSISDLALSQIKQATTDGKSIRTFAIFAGDWEQQRVVLVEISKCYAGDNCPFDVFENHGDSEQAEYLSPKKLQHRLKAWRDIELETQLHQDLEMGVINDHNEFQAHDEDWTD